MTLIAIFGLVRITSAQVPSYVPTAGLQGYYPFNGNANDESGNGNNGIVNGATLTQDRFGNVSKAYSFNGVNNNVTMNSVNLTNMSISIWFKKDNNINTNPNNGHPPIGAEIFGQGTQHQPSVTYSDFAFGISSYSNPNDFFSFENSNLSTSTWTDYNLGNASNLDTNWQHAVITIQGTLLKLYLNGQNYGGTILSNSIFNSGAPLSVGSRYVYQAFSGTGFCNFFSGNLDDIGIWNRELTPQEITDLYNGCQLTVNPQPSSQAININNIAQFIVGSSDPNTTYQWQTDLGVGYQNLNSLSQYSGTANDTLTVSNVTMSNNNQPFRCIISSGSCTDTSNVAVLTVNNNVGLFENTQNNLFSVFPNPAHSVINIKANINFIGKNYAIYNNTGRVVLTGKLNSENTIIELGNLSGGVYMFSAGENMKQTFKIIKE